MEDEEVKEALRLKQQRWLLLWKRSKEDGRASGRRPIPEGLIEEGRSEKRDTLEGSLHGALPVRRSTFDKSEIVGVTNEVSEQRAHHGLHRHHSNPRRVSSLPDSTEESPIALHTAFDSIIPSTVAHTEDSKESAQPSPIIEGVSNGAPSSTPASLFSKFLFYVRTLPGPVTITIIVAFIISIIPPLKALFVPLKHEDARGWNAGYSACTRWRTAARLSPPHGYLPRECVSATRSCMCRGSIGQIEDGEKGKGLAVGRDLCAGIWEVDSPTRDRGVYNARIGQSRGPQ